MNRSLLTWIVQGVLYSSIVLLDLTVWRRFGWLSTVADPSLLMVIVVTSFQGWRNGLLAAALAAWGTSLFSIFPVWIHPAAWLAVVISVWGTSRRMLTNRSTASFLGLGAIGTITYTAVLASLIGIVRLIVPEAPTPEWQPWWFQSGIHLITHPLLAWLIWRLSARSRHYFTTQFSPDQSF